MNRTIAIQFVDKFELGSRIVNAYSLGRPMHVSVLELKVARVPRLGMHTTCPREALFIVPPGTSAIYSVKKTLDTCCIPFERLNSGRGAIPGKSHS